MAKNHKIKYGSRYITFELEYRQRKTMEISVYPDMSVRVKAPVSRSIEQIKQKIHKRASWIMEQKYFFSLFLPEQPRRQFISGETHTYLGKKYRLKILKREEEQVKLIRGCLLVHVSRQNDPKRVKTLLEGWYKKQAQTKFEQRLNLCMQKVQKHGIGRPLIQIRKMSKRWGSCTKSGTLLLNLQLIKASAPCIDYVIMHELCHLKYFNHGSAFYDLFYQIMPDWEKRKKKLELVNI